MDEPKLEKPDNIDPRIKGLSTLLLLQKEARHAANEDIFAFIAVNETYKIVPYRLALLWHQTVTGGVEIKAASSVATIEKNSPFIQWLRKAIAAHLKTPNARQVHTLRKEDFSKDIQKEWDEWCSPHVAWCPFISHDQLIGGLWLDRETAFQDKELTLLEHLSDSYAYSWWGLSKRNTTAPFHWRNVWGWLAAKNRKRRFIIIAIILGLLFFPVRQSALAPAEIIPIAPTLVTSPFDGVIKKIHVKPNEVVAKDQLLVSLDDTNIRNQNNVAQKAFEVAQAEYRKATNESFSEAESRAKLAVLESQVEQRAVEVVYTDELLDQVDIEAEIPGIAVFSDPNKWIGRPVITGEKIMLIADPNQAELEIYLPVDDFIPLEAAAKIKLFLNIDPLNAIDAELFYVSYEAEMTPDGILAYRLRAKFEPGEKIPRIGLKGTAKIYGERVSLFYYIMRRPLAALRRILGL